MMHHFDSEIQHNMAKFYHEMSWKHLSNLALTSSEDKIIILEYDPVNKIPSLSRSNLKKKKVN